MLKHCLNMGLSLDELYESAFQVDSLIMNVAQAVL
ncbi:hypothetical protein PM8797T_31243 [Gimesia maris DSM 8797]|nr:hypothetical protein PM8797T_31243 [Gimesia maris DSM 8797]